MSNLDGVFVRIKKGTYRLPPHERKVEDKIFALAKPFYTGTDDRTKVSVHGTSAGGLEDRVCRIFCTLADFEYVDKDGNPIELSLAAEEDAASIDDSDRAPTGVDYEKLFLASESEQEAMDRIRGSFKMFDNIVEAVCSGTIRGLIVCGPPGVGKSYGVENILTGHDISKGSKDRPQKFEIVKGYASPINIYKTLWEHSAKDHVVVFDDCDDALMDDTALNILKAALDSGDRRTICWLAESRVLKAEGIEGKFDFNGNVIFLTNYDFDKVTSPRLKAHMDAMMSRCHYLDLNIGCQRDRLLRIKQIVGDGMLEPYGLTPEAEKEVVDYVFKNADHMRELSLRMVKKIADLRKSMPINWKAFTETTCLKRGAAYQRRYEELQAKRLTNAGDAT